MSYYTWITDTVAIGELNASYHNFDLIVNLAYINPSFNKGLQHKHHRFTKLENSTLLEIGLWDSDCDTEYLLEALTILSDVIEKIEKIEKIENKKILFHCQSGKCRSVVFAAVYLHLSNIFPLPIVDIIDKIKEKRPIVSPRPSFVKKAEEFIKS